MANDDYRRDSGDSVSTRLTYLLIGGGIGAVIALLFAPKSGQELRGDIADATRKGIDKSREAAQQLGDRAGTSLIQQHHGLVRELLRGFQAKTQAKASTLNCMSVPWPTFLRRFTSVCYSPSLKFSNSLC